MSGSDILKSNSTVCIANQDEIIKGFKFSQDIIKILKSRRGQGFIVINNLQEAKLFSEYVFTA